MPIEEIELEKPTAFHVFQWKANTAGLVADIAERGTKFTAESGCGFHDMDGVGSVVRGCYSVLTSFEVEHYVDGITTKNLLKRIDWCEFIGNADQLYAFGKSPVIKAMTHAMSGVTAHAVNPRVFEWRELNGFQEKLSVCKAIVLTNPRDKEVRRCRMAGSIESYTDYNVIDPKNHGIDSVSGSISSPIGPIDVTVGRGGVVRIGAKRGTVVPLDCLEWLVRLVVA